MIVSPLVTNREKNPLHKRTFKWGAKLLDGYFWGQLCGRRVVNFSSPRP